MKMHSQHRFGSGIIIGAIISVVAVFVVGYLMSGKITLMQKDDNTIYSKKRYKERKDTTYKRAKRYNIYNYYYEKSSSQPIVTKQSTDNITNNFQPSSKPNSTKNKKYVGYNDIILDINTADTLDMQILRGIGPAYARRIYKLRQKLGGFYSIDQLKEVYGMTDSLYNQIKTHFVVSKIELKKININKATIKELMYHPYLDYKLAKEIVLFRQNHGNFMSVEDLNKVYLMDESTYNKFSPYATTK